MTAAAVILAAILAADFALWTRAARKSWLIGHPSPLRRLLRGHLLTAAAFIMLFPFYWMIVNSMMSDGEAGRYPPSFWPDAAAAFQWRELWRQTFDNYARAWFAAPGDLSFGRYFRVSIVVALTTTVGVLLTSIPAAYAFALMRFRGREALFFLLLGTLMIPAQVLVIPQYLILERLGWLNTYPALIAPFVASVFVIFLFRQFFRSSPIDLWDAARIDGAGRLRFLLRILVPQAVPIVVTASILTFLGQWNALLWPLIATTSPEMRTLMVGLQSFNQEAGAQTNVLMAAAVMTMLPIVLLFFAMQRFFIQSVARTGLKT